VPTTDVGDPTNWGRFRRPPLAITHNEQHYYWINGSAPAAAAARERLTARLDALLDPRVNGSVVAAVCAAFADALPFAGFNGVLDATLARTHYESELDGLLPGSVDGVIAIDVKHMSAAWVMSAAMREHGADRTAAMAIVRAISAEARCGAVPCDGGHSAESGGPVDALVHAAVWQQVVAQAHGAPTARFWAVGMEVCAEWLNSYAYIHCVHGLGASRAIR
jgi:hypothetical protein